MKKEEKAEELISKYVELSVLITPKKARIDWVIMSALIAVDEIIKIFDDTNGSDYRFEYWQDVKKEIEKFKNK